MQNPQPPAEQKTSAPDRTSGLTSVRGGVPAPSLTIADVRPSERRILFLLGAVQFVNILDFMMVMPLGPDFAHALSFPASQLGLIGGSYAAAACVSGLVASTFIDRFDRRSALGVAMAGLVVATALGGFATGLSSMVAARMLAGMFGGPATSLSLSIVADVVPPARRGKALGSVMGAFSVASVLGLPIALKIGELGTWRTPFFAVAFIGLLVAGSAVRVLPKLRGHLDQSGDALLRTLEAPLGLRPEALLSWLMTGVLMFSIFSLVPFLSAYTQFNLGYPRARLDLLYMFGGATSFFMMRLSGRLTDRLGEVRMATIGTVIMVVVVYFGFIHFVPGTPVMALFIGFMAASSVRNVPLSSLTSKVPSPSQRGRFMSTQSAIQHASAAVASLVGSMIVHGASPSSPSSPLVGIPTVAAITAVLAAVVPVLMALVAARLRARL